MLSLIDNLSVCCHGPLLAYSCRFGYPIPYIKHVREKAYKLWNLWFWHDKQISCGLWKNRGFCLYKYIQKYETILLFPLVVIILGSLWLALMPVFLCCCCCCWVPNIGKIFEISYTVLVGSPLSDDDQPVSDVEGRMSKLLISAWIRGHPL